jgi:hypothetical protein
MQASEHFSSTEIMSVLRECGVDEMHFLNEDETESPGSPTIDCRWGSLRFSCCLFGMEPLFGHVFLVASIPVATRDPFEFANKLNSMCSTATVYLALDDEDQILWANDGEYSFTASTSIDFGGGVTAAHLKQSISVWIEDVFELFWSEESDSDGSEFLEIPHEDVREMGIADQVSWVLGTDAVPRTARQIASFLMKEKHEVNSVLYRYSDVFRKDDSQPPRWFLHGRTTGK